MKILLIQDILLMPTNAKIVLSKFGKVVEINDGLDTINKFITSHRAELNFDVIFVDLVLPRISGIDIIKYIRKIENYSFINRPYIAIMCPHGCQVDINSIIEAGADKIFIKPITHQSVEKYFREINLIE